MILDVHGLNQTAPFFHFKPFEKVQRLGPRSRNRSEGGVGSFFFWGTSENGEKNQKCLFDHLKIKMR